MKIIKNIGQCLTSDGLIKNCAIRIENGIIDWVGSEREARTISDEEEAIDAGGTLVTPGLIDSHTHLMFGGIYDQGRIY